LLPEVKMASGEYHLLRERDTGNQFVATNQFRRHSQYQLGTKTMTLKDDFGILQSTLLRLQAIGNSNRHCFIQTIIPLTLGIHPAHFLWPVFGPNFSFRMAQIEFVGQLRPINDRKVPVFFQPQIRHMQIRAAVFYKIGRGVTTTTSFVNGPTIEMNKSGF